MSRFLDQIMAAKRQQMRQVTDEQRATVREQAFAAMRGARPRRLRSAFENRERVNIIAEIKRSSPSAGAIRPTASVQQLAQYYENAGAAAISILTEPDHFGGSLFDLQDGVRATQIPVLRKDFICDEHQVLEAACAGAAAVLLIVAALDDDQLRTLLDLTEQQLGLDALVEIHNEEELVRALDAGATIVGVNNRNLQTLEVSLDVSRGIAADVPKGITLVAESGISTASQIAELHALGFSGFLIGEALMRAADPSTKLGEFLAALPTPKGAAR